MTEQVQGFRNCTAQGHTPFTCALYLESLSQDLEDIFFHADQLMRGMYSIWLHVWMSFFPTDSFLVIKAEDYYAKPRQVLVHVFAHLGLSHPTEEEWTRILGTSEVRTAATGQDMLPAARALAGEFYASYNVDLAQMMGDAKWQW